MLTLLSFMLVSLPAPVPYLHGDESLMLNYLHQYPPCLLHLTLAIAAAGRQCVSL
jgi:hypothetical protein